MGQGKVCLAADVSVVAMTPDLGAEIRGVDLSAPLSDACFARIHQTFQRYCAVFLRGQELDPRLLARFAARFGEAEATPSDERALPGLPQVGVLGTGEDAAPAAAAGGRWQTDRSYESAPPAVTLLYAAGTTDAASAEFVNMYSVLNALPAQKRLLVQKLRAVHERPAAGHTSPGAQDPHPANVEHPLVRIHPGTGKRALYLARDVMLRAVGMRDEDSRKLLEQLEAFATQPRFVYAHRWRKGDVLVWDNRCTLHRIALVGATTERPVYRIRIKGEAPIAG